MRKLFLQKIEKATLCKKWQTKGTLIGEHEELFVRSNKKGQINWNKTVLYFWDDVVKAKENRHVIFTLPPYPDYLLD